MDIYEQRALELEEGLKNRRKLFADESDEVFEDSESGCLHWISTYRRHSSTYKGDKTFWNDDMTIQDYFSDNGSRLVGGYEFSEFWKSLTHEEKRELRTMNLS